MAVETQGAYALYEAKQEQKSEEAKKRRADELAKERQLIDQATQAGFDKSEMYKKAADQYGQYMRQGMQSAAQLTPRMLQGASSFNAPGGASIVAAEAVAPSIAAAQSQLGMTGTDKIAEANLGGAESEINAAEYAMSAMPSVVQNKKVLGYLDTYGSLRETLSDQEAQNAIWELLATELDPGVAAQVKNTILAMR